MVNILIVGNREVGKTALCGRLANDLFIPRYTPSKGINPVKLCINQNPVVLLDTTGTLNRNHPDLKSVNTVFVVIDDFTKYTATAWKLEFQDLGYTGPIWLIINKCDLYERTPFEYDEFCKKYHYAGWIETSAKTKHGIDQLIKTIDAISKDGSSIKEPIIDNNCIINGNNDCIIGGTAGVTSTWSQDKNYKIAVMGHAKTGVTSFVNVMNNKFISMKFIELNNLPNNHDIDGIMIMVDRNNTSSVSAHRYWINKLESYGLTLKPCLLLINKCDVQIEKYNDKLYSDLGYQHRLYISTTNDEGLSTVITYMTKLIEIDSKHKKDLDNIKISKIEVSKDFKTTNIESSIPVADVKETKVEYKPKYNPLFIQFSKNLNEILIDIDLAGTNIDLMSQYCLLLHTDTIQNEIKDNKSFDKLTKQISHLVCCDLELDEKITKILECLIKCDI